MRRRRRSPFEAAARGGDARPYRSTRRGPRVAAARYRRRRVRARARPPEATWPVVSRRCRLSPVARASAFRVARVRRTDTRHDVTRSHDPSRTRGNVIKRILKRSTADPREFRTKTVSKRICSTNVRPSLKIISLKTD